MQLPKLVILNRVLQLVYGLWLCAQAEVEYEDKKSDAIDVVSVVDLKDLSARLNIDVQDATDP